MVDQRIHKGELQAKKSIKKIGWLFSFKIKKGRNNMTKLKTKMLVTISFVLMLVVGAFGFAVGANINVPISADALAGSWATVNINICASIINSDRLDNVKSWTFTNQCPYNNVNFLETYDKTIGVIEVGSNDLAGTTIYDGTGTAGASSLKAYFVKNGTMKRCVGVDEKNKGYDENGNINLPLTEIDAYDVYVYANVEKIYLPSTTKTQTWRNSIFLHSPDSIHGDNVETITFDSCVSTKNTTSFEDMFSGQPWLTTINGLENFDTSKVTNMSNMFSSDASLKLTNNVFSNWDLSKVEDMSEMFAFSSAKNNLDFSIFAKAQSLKNVSSMFIGLSIKTIDEAYFAAKFIMASSNDMDVDEITNDQFDSILNSFPGDTKADKIITMAIGVGMQGDIGNDTRYKATSIDLSNFDFSNVTEATNMLYGCDNLSTIKTPKNMGQFTLKNLGIKDKEFYVSGTQTKVGAEDAIPANVTLVSNVATPSTGVELDILASVISIAFAVVILVVVVKNKKSKQIKKS
jgi:surface protein